MQLIDHTPETLAEYTARQIAAVVPDGRTSETEVVLKRHMAETLERVHRCIRGVRAWRPDEFNYLHSSQYCQYLYYLSNTIWRREKDAGTGTRLFLLNKALNAIDLFYEIEMPEVFFIGHSVGIVLAKASYGNHLVLYQNSTVGRHLDQIPVLEEGVILYPNSAVIGGSCVSAGSVVAQGVSVIGATVPKDSMVFSGGGGDLIFKRTPETLLAEYFRL